MRFVQVIATDTPSISFMNEQLCMFPNCSKNARSRGLCKTHYKQYSRSVLKNQTTWEELEAQGLCNPPVLSLPKVMQYPDQNAEYPDFQHETWKAVEPVEPLELTWEDREFLTAVNYRLGIDQYSKELFDRAVNQGWLEKENGQWWLSDLGAKVVEEFNRNLFADTDFPLESREDWV